MSKAKCHDCARPYGDKHGFPDLIVPSYIWRRISPTKNLGGLLCPSCICKRLYDAKIKSCPASFMSGPIRSVSEDLMQVIRSTENLTEELVRKSYIDT